MHHLLRPVFHAFPSTARAVTALLPASASVSAALACASPSAVGMPPSAPPAQTEEVAAVPVRALGQFTENRDLGGVRRAGSTVYDGAQGYRLSGSGANIWGSADEFQFAYRKVSGDAALGARITFEGVGGSEYKKAVLMIRENLQSDSPFVALALHGGGLASLQYRPRVGAATEQLRSSLSGPAHGRLTRTGNAFTANFSLDGKDWETVGPVEVVLPREAWTGLGMCAHDVGALETATFHDVELAATDVRP